MNILSCVSGLLPKESSGWSLHQPRRAAVRGRRAAAPVLLALPLLLAAIVIRPAVAQQTATSVLDTEIVYATGTSGIWVVEADGSGAHKIASGVDPQFSPDGSLIAYAGTEARGLFVMNADGSDPHEITSGNDDYPSWSPDGRSLAFVHSTGVRSAIFVVGADGRGLRRLTSGDDADSHPDWSPNGTLITFARTSLRRRLPKPQVMTIGPNGSGLSALVAGSTPTFSPDGAQIAFTTQHNDVAVVNLDRSDRLVLAPGESPTWSPDGTMLAFARKDTEGSAGIWRIDSNGRNLLPISDPVTVTSLSWQPDPALLDWPQFGYEPGMSDDDPQPTGITGDNVGSLVGTQVPLQGTVDSSPIYLQSVEVDGALRNVFIVQTTYGRAYAIDADSGQILWRYVPDGLRTWQGGDEITTASPAADPDRRYVYVATPNGLIHKLQIADGNEVRDAGWPVRVLDNPTKEKISSSLAIDGGYLYAATAGLSIKIGGDVVGDAPRQGHLVAIDLVTGQIAHVFYALCSNQTTLSVPSACPQEEAGIWGRPPATFEPDGDILVATGNGLWDGRTYWGDSVVELSPDLRLLQSYTPADQVALNANDGDLGSSAPALIGSHYAVQAGKDGKLKLLDLDLLNGRLAAPGPYLGGELQIIRAPGGYNEPGDCEVVSQPAVWVRPEKPPLIFVANDCGVDAYSFLLHPTPHLVLYWEDGRPGSSPVLAGGLLYVDNVDDGALDVYNPDPPVAHIPEGFEPIAILPLAAGHWNSPIVGDGVVAVGEGNANGHLTSGFLEIYRLKLSSEQPGASTAPAAASTTPAPTTTSSTTTTTATTITATTITGTVAAATTRKATE